MMKIIGLIAVVAVILTLAALCVSSGESTEI